ncbi:MAG: class I SAM-dependent methyltransferase [Cyanobacteriota bacterium]|nr:class I SAM-dependent methyltransferase [Cyanobacteriota bacterium]
MAHQSQRDFITHVSTGLPGFFRDSKVLEVGSLDINGSVRDFFSNCNYTGLDIAPGPGVDVVCQGQDYDAPDHSYDHVISCEAMEHNPYWKETFDNMVRMCRPGGLVTLTCATVGRIEHGTARSAPATSPLTIEAGWNYYRNLLGRDFERNCQLSSAFSAYRMWYDWTSFDFYLLGIRKTNNFRDGLAASWEATASSIDQHIAHVNRGKVYAYRGLVARVAGDKGFLAMRNLLEKLNYIHDV